MIRTLRDYLELTKPRVTTWVVLTAWMGFAFGSAGKTFSGLWFLTMLGTALVAAGASALNQYMERDLDAKMRRTQNRPLPQKRILPRKALIFGISLAAAGAVTLAWGVNFLTSLLSLVSLGSYLLLYTPLKTRTSLCTLVGALPGSLPPVMGWTAARETLAPHTWVLFAILYVWQLPHFLAIAWMYKEDYARAGFPMLPVIDPGGGSTARMMILYSAILIPVTLLPAQRGLVGFSYFYGALGLGIAFLACSVLAAFFRTPAHARRLLLASVIYLPALLTWMVFAA
ncbi:MAG: protoheme IX farnesyltransferase [Elusimicrobia bacterium RIFCSPLOWO2_01_FULL_59_12]|nr:MAG: protoheme IX farnesyltransferase [Elusimicrobia bacterium RIFCSPLOWO2_01_FULL_59_12]